MEKIRGGQTSTLELPWARLLSAKAVPVHMDRGAGMGPGARYQR
ncbi:hypothetical protein ACFOHW_00010 [Paenibacillus abyssi]